MISRKNMIIITLSLFTSILAGGCSSSAFRDANEYGVKDHLDIVIFKIGKADSILLSMGEQTVLIDTVMTFNTCTSFKMASAPPTSSDKNPEEKEVIDVLNQLGTEVYVTRNGDIHISSDGESLRINQ